MLRHPPPGPTLPTAHDLAREHRYLSALAGTAVPVASSIAFCDDPEVIGAPFLIATRMAGVCLLGGPDVGDTARSPSTGPQCRGHLGRYPHGGWQRPGCRFVRADI